MSIENIREIKANAPAKHDRSRGVNRKVLYCNSNHEEIHAAVIVKIDEKALSKWFKDRHSEMTGKCANCGGKTQKGQKNYKCSVCHILPKAIFPSVATHPLNFIELCFYEESCHTNLDNGIIDVSKMKCYKLIIVRFLKIYPSIAKNERKNIPDVFMQHLQPKK